MIKIDYDQDVTSLFKDGHKLERSESTSDFQFHVTCDAIDRMTEELLVT